MSIARSEAIPAGAFLDFTVVTYAPYLMDFVETWLELGKRFGLGQWRSSGKGTFTWEKLDG